MRSFFQRHLFAIACVAAPLLFATLGPNLTITWLTAGGDVRAIKLDYRLRDAGSAARSKTTADSAQPAAPAPGAAAPAGAASKNDESTAKLDLVAHHVSGLINFALVSVFIYFVAAAAFAICVAFVWQRAGRAGFALITVAAVAASATQAHLMMAREERRFLLVDNILRLADSHEILKHVPVFRRVITLTEVNVAAGVFAFFMLGAVLYVATVRRGAATDRNDLLSRAFVMRLVLFVASANLVLSVLFARALVDWPLGLLIDADKTALATAGDALTHFWGTVSTLAIIAGAAPALASWYLDREAYRGKRSGTETKPPALEDGLEIAPMSMVTGVIAVLAPVIASPTFDALKLLVSAVSK